MLFNSYFFICIFLPIVLCIWWSSRLSVRARLIALVGASYFFYGWWDYRFVMLLALSSIVDFHVGKRLFASSNQRGRRIWLSVSLVTNLGLLAFFKYSGFMAESMNAIADWLRMGGAVPVPEVMLPVGISFYTFQTLSYTIDIYRRQSKPTESFWHFAAYVSLFPQLIAGPIVRYSELESQLRSIPSGIRWNQFSNGIFFFVAGLAQKILLADTIAERINPLFADYQSLELVGSWFAMLGYTCQLYFDFSGYSNMAVGLGLMLGFQFPQNFDSPYKSANIAHFWRRWHMTLSYFLRDYLFIPLGGSRVSQLITLRNLVIVMFLGGLWHGAGGTFILWGLYHGALLVAHALFRQRYSIPYPVAIFLTFLSVVFGWVLFRSTDMTMCLSLWESMLGLNGFDVGSMQLIGGIKSLAVVAFLLTIVFFTPNVWQIKFRPTLPWAFAFAALFVVCVLRFDAQSPFLYFQF